MDYQQPIFPDPWLTEPTPISSTPTAKPVTPTPDYWKAAEKAAKTRSPQWMSEMPTSHPGMDTFKNLPKMVDVMGKEYVRPQTVFNSGLKTVNGVQVQVSPPSATVLPGYYRDVVIGQAVEAPKVTASLGRQVGSGALSAYRIAGVASIGYAGFVDYADGLNAGESQFRSGTNAIAGMGGAYGGGLAGAKLGGALGAGIGSTFAGIGAVPGAAVGGFIGGVAGSIGGSGVAGWASDRLLDLFGGPKSIPNPNGPSGNPFSPKDPFGAPRPSIPQPTAQSPGGPPSGPGTGMPKTTIPTDPSAGNPLFPLLPWLPEWKFPRMPWDPQAPEKPTPDPKKPAKPGNPGAPNGGKPIEKPVTPPIIKVPGIWRTVVTGPGVWGSTTLEGVYEEQGYDGPQPSVKLYQGVLATDPNTQQMELSSGSKVYAVFFQNRQSAIAWFIPTPTPENTPKPTPPSEIKPGPTIPRPQTQPPDNSRPGTPDPGFPGNFSPPSFAPPVLPFIPLGFPPSPPNIGYLGEAPSQGSNPGNQVPAPSQPGPDADHRMPGALPTGETPATIPQTAPQNSPASQQAPTLERSPAQIPTANSPKIRIPGTVPKGNTTTTYESPTFEQWVKNNPAPWNNPETSTPTASLDIKTPSTTTTTGNPFSSQNTGFTKPVAKIPANIPLPIGAPIPRGAIPQPIIEPDKPAPSANCNYRPDATISVGLASYNPLTDTITYTPTLVSASNAAGFQHLAQETANMRKEVSGIHKVLEVDLYRAPTGKTVAPKVEVEVLQAVLSVSPLAAVPLIKTLPQEMKVLAAMHHMYAGHHLLGNIKVSSNPANAKAATYAPRTAVGMQFELYNNVTSMIGLPNAVSTVTAKGAIIDSPFKNSMDALENVSAVTQGLETDISGIQEMLFKVLQNQEMAINMIHKETFKTEVLIKDSGCRISEIPVQRPSVMSHGNAKTPIKKGFNWLNVFTGSKTYTNVPVWKGDIDKQQLGLKTNMEAQKANTSVYFPIANSKEETKLPRLQTRPKKGNEFNRFVKTLNEDIPGNSGNAILYDGPGLPKSKLEEVILGNVKKIVLESDVEFIGSSPPLAGVKKGNKVN